MIYVMRGLPGSGKSTWAQSIPGAEILSADSWHTFNGIYKFDLAKVGFAHNECLRCFLSVIQRREPPKHIIVDNTNCSLMELAPYVRLAEIFDKEYLIRYIVCPLEVAMRRNKHAVPVNTLLRMQANLLTELIPVYWKQEVVLAEQG